MKIKYKKLRDNAVVPKMGSDSAGAMDLTAAHIEVGESEVIVYSGLAIEMIPGTIRNDNRRTLKQLADNDLGDTNVTSPINWRLMLAPRSSFTKYNWVVQNSPCIIDQDYRGEIYTKFKAIPTGIKLVGWMQDKSYNLTYDDFPYKVGDRYMQCWVEKVEPVEWEESELSDTERGSGGFGSTGK